MADGKTLWIHGENLTMPVSLENAKCWLLPSREAGGAWDAEPARLIRWDRTSTITDGAKVFVAGPVKLSRNRWRFASSKEEPLAVIFYDCPYSELPSRVMAAWQNSDGYWNSVTAASIAAGALSLFYFAYSFLGNPAFQPTVVISIFAVFIPALPFIPPGLLFTVFSRGFLDRARKLRTCMDIAKLPLRHLGKGASPLFPSGEEYGFRAFDSLPAGALEGGIPLLLKGLSPAKGRKGWHIFGAVEKGAALPSRPSDPFACFGALPGPPRKLAFAFFIKAYALEALGFLLVLSGIGINVYFFYLILMYLEFLF